MELKSLKGSVEGKPLGQRGGEGGGKCLKGTGTKWGGQTRCCVTRDESP